MYMRRWAPNKAVDDFRMDFCDLIVSMEQAEINPRGGWGDRRGERPRCVLLLWLLYVPCLLISLGAGCFCALNALLNGLCAISLCLGLYFIKHHNREHIARACCWHSRSFHFSHQLHREPRTARRHDFPGHGPVRTLYLSILPVT